MQRGNYRDVTHFWGRKDVRYDTQHGLFGMVPASYIADLDIAGELGLIKTFREPVDFSVSPRGDISINNLVYSCI